MKNLRAVGKLLFASYAMTVAVMMIVFVVMLFYRGFDTADQVWRWYYFLPIFLMSLAICFRWLGRQRGKAGNEKRGAGLAS
jgi:uncharacterized membrane protein